MTLCIKTESQIDAVAKLQARSILTTVNCTIRAEGNSGKQRASADVVLTSHPVNFA